MSTTKQPLKYLWTATFADGHIIQQPEDDRYSQHDDTSEWNPSSFRDILDYMSESHLTNFELASSEDRHGLELNSGVFSINGTRFTVGDSGDNKLIYFRNVIKQWIDGVEQEPKIVSYSFGYEYKNNKGKTLKRIVELDG